MKLDQRWQTGPVFYLPNQPQNNVALKFSKVTLNFVNDSDNENPSYAYPSDSGFDLRASEEVWIQPNSRALIPTGIRLDIGENYEVQVRSKSGLALKHGLMVLNSPGTVDNGYTGEVQVIVFNTNNYIVTIPKGMKIGQAILCPVVNGGWVGLTQVDAITQKERGTNGFGSTKLF
jgi:dUTP pyrophosphatase